MAHIHDKIDFTASVYIVHEGRVLLHLHKKLNKWLQPGGHIELHEDPNEAVLREAHEETGLQIQLIGNPQIGSPLKDGSRDLVPPKYLNRHRFNEIHEHIDFVYFARVVEGELTPEDGVEMRWFTRDEIERNDIDLLDDVRLYALAALDELA